MKFKKIVGFGDSWMWGDELLDPALPPDVHPSMLENRPYREKNCFLGVLGEHYQVPTENFGVAGGSLQTAIWNFLWWLDREQEPDQCLILVQNTYPDRIAHFDPDYKNKKYYQEWYRYFHWGYGIPDEVRNMMRTQIALTVCPEWSHLNYSQSVLLFDGMAARRKLNLIQFNNIQPDHSLTHVPTLIWPDWNLADYFNNLKQTHGMKYLKPNLHPNELGHDLIAQKLIEYIDHN